MRKGNVEYGKKLGEPDFLRDHGFKWPKPRKGTKQSLEFKSDPKWKYSSEKDKAATDPRTGFTYYVFYDPSSKTWSMGEWQYGLGVHQETYQSPLSGFKSEQSAKRMAEEWTRDAPERKRRATYFQELRQAEKFEKERMGRQRRSGP